MSVPIQPKDITASWLTLVLRERGYLSDGRVHDVKIEVLDPASSIFGTLARLHLRYHGESGDLPETMVAKLPSSSTGAAGYLRSMGGDRAEVELYRQVGDSIGLRIPKCFYSTLDEATGGFVILMEDLSPYRSPSSAEGLTDLEIFAVVKSLASSHAAWWQNPGLAKFHWLPSLTTDTERFYSGFLVGWPILVEQLGNGAPELNELGTEIAHRVRLAQERLTTEPVTFLHMDVRQENLFFVKEEESLIPIFIDWQIIRWGRGAASLASFLAFLPQRDRLEEDAVRLYHIELERAGVRDYAFETFWQDYRMSVLRRFNGPTSVLASVAPNSSQGRSLIELLSRFGLENLERYL